MIKVLDYFWELVNDLLSPKFEHRNELPLELTPIHQFNLLEILDSFGIVKLWDIVTGECIETLGRFGKPIISMACSYDGKFIADGTYDGIVNIWDIKNSQSIEILQEKYSSIWSLAFSSDSNFLVIGRDRENFLLWDINGGKISWGDKRLQSISPSCVCFNFRNIIARV
ncbi:MAG: hypothetical protein F6K08_34250 [Okeania sp. SIO1H6]|nr:hypothetical protein [Okeania sp. SIO1H6]